MTRCLRVAAWVLLAAIIAVTLVPEQFRPQTPLPLKVERGLAFAILAFAFTLSYTKHWLAILAILCSFALGLELAQFLVPSRDPSPVDAVVKTAGVIIGVIGALLARRLATALHRSRTS